MHRRLFIFAAYDPLEEVGEGLMYYLKALSELGDVVLYADCSLSGEQLDKLGPYVLWAGASRHGEYDFGSYRRCMDHVLKDGVTEISDYAYVYLVNDSVYGPLRSLETYLEKMEGLGTEAFSLVLNPHKGSTHMQSWFIGMTVGLFREPWLQDFFSNVVALSSKNEVCIRYETGFSQLLQQRNIAFRGLFAVPGRQIYNSPLKLYAKGLPFVKKSSFVRHRGCLGGQISHILKKCPEECSGTIKSDFDRIHGAGSASRLLECGPFTAALRYFHYLFDRLNSRLGDLAERAMPL